MRLVGMLLVCLLAVQMACAFGIVPVSDQQCVVGENVTVLVLVKGGSDAKDVIFVMEPKGPILVDGQSEYNESFHLAAGGTKVISVELSSSQNGTYPVQYILRESGDTMFVTAVTGTFDVSVTGQNVQPVSVFVPVHSSGGGGGGSYYWPPSINSSSNSSLAPPSPPSKAIVPRSPPVVMQDVGTGGAEMAQGAVAVSGVLGSSVNGVKGISGQSKATWLVLGLGASALVMQLAFLLAYWRSGK